ncbi:MAG: L-histidine N(alpha)-methyltransferase [Taibaiella sp.]|jgi:dimethylhistidine N-methyltransferase
MKPMAMNECKAKLEMADTSFKTDVIRGLSARQKFLESKYFYDAAGDQLFQQIMQSPEYYLTNAEMEIMLLESEYILNVCRQLHDSFDIVELGAGDASKTIHLLKRAFEKGVADHYFPIDISANVIQYLNTTLPEKIPGMEVEGLAGEYFQMLEALNNRRNKPKLVLFMGATIGNMLPDEALVFCKELHAYLNEGDMLLIGFDLKKDPKRILDAYNDAAGITREFNLNLLRRINRELGSNFNVEKFEHYPIYDPGTGSCKSYLISKEKQLVSLDDGTTFSFEKHEPIYMEVSQKYNQKEITLLAKESGFESVSSFFDRKKLFVDTLWKVPSLKNFLVTT